MRGPRCFSALYIEKNVTVIHDGISSTPASGLRKGLFASASSVSHIALADNLIIDKFVSESIHPFSIPAFFLRDTEVCQRLCVGKSGDIQAITQFEIPNSPHMHFFGLWKDVEMIELMAFFL